MTYNGETLTSDLDGTITLGSKNYQITASKYNREDAPTFGSADELVIIGARRFVVRKEGNNHRFIDGDKEYVSSFSYFWQVDPMTGMEPWEGSREVVQIDGVLYDATKLLAPKTKYVLREKQAQSELVVGQVVEVNAFRYVVTVNADGSVVFDNGTQKVTTEVLADKIILYCHFYSLYF